MMSYKINFFSAKQKPYHPSLVILIMLHDLYILPQWWDWRMGWLVYVECMGRHEGKRLFWRLGIDEMIILKWVLNKC